jgi:hypothetical protein
MTGLLYLMVIVMWAVVLVPIWLKNHERTQLEQKLREAGELPTKWHLAQRPERDARTQAFIRRRRTLMVLLSTLIGAVLLAASGKISPFLIVVPSGLLAAFVAVAIKVARTPQRMAVPVRTVARPVVQQPAAAPAVVTTQAKPSESRTWQPVESPIPSYVRAAKATPYPRNLDADKPWTSQEMLEQAARLRQEQNRRRLEGQARLEAARALVMEKARRAALGAQERTQTAQVQKAAEEATNDQQRAVNE